MKLVKSLRNLYLFFRREIRLVFYYAVLSNTKKILYDIERCISLNLEITVLNCFSDFASN